MRRQTEMRARPVDVHRPLPLVRNLEDYPVDDEAAAVPDPDQVVAAITIRKRDIPTPVIREVATYNEEQPSGYAPPVSYIRFPKKPASSEEDLRTAEYCLEAEDEQWLRRHPKLGESGALHGRLDDDTLERMLDILEKLTGTGPPAAQPQAENAFMGFLGMSRALYHEVWSEVVAYWRQKRQRQGSKPLLRRFWPATSTNDTDPHKVFRPREKDRYKLRKHRMSDRESHRRLVQLRRDFERCAGRRGMASSADPLRRKKKRREREERERHSGGSGSAAATVAVEDEDFDEDGLPAGGISGGSASSAATAAAAAAAAEEVARLVATEPPSFMDPLATRQNFRETVLEVVEPNLPIYTPAAIGKSRRGPAPVYKYRCRGRMGRGGRVVFDRVPVRGPGDYCSDGAGNYYGDDEPPPPAAVVVSCAGAGSAHAPAPPAVHRLQPPPLCLHVNERRVREIYAMEDENDDATVTLEPNAFGGGPGPLRPPGAPVVNYSILV
ncbi:unnamed protein product [Phaeothamnion confervicola]